MPFLISRISAVAYDDPAVLDVQAGSTAHGPLPWNTGPHRHLQPHNSDDLRQHYQRLNQAGEPVILSCETIPGSDQLRTYRLLDAFIDEAFSAAEAEKIGSGLRHPLIVISRENDLLKAAAEVGALLIDGRLDAIALPALSHPMRQAFALFQATKARTSKADYVACPSCGRTLFDLIEVTAHVKEATAHLDGLTIAVMGCIVNGPGEMADADYGFVGTGPRKVTIYRGKEPVRKNVAFDDARQALIDTITEDGRWREPAIAKLKRLSPSETALSLVQLSEFDWQAIFF